MHLQRFAYNLTFNHKTMDDGTNKHVRCARPNQNRVKCANKAVFLGPGPKIALLLIVIWQCFSRQLHQTINRIDSFEGESQILAFLARKNGAKFVQTLKMNRKLNV